MKIKVLIIGATGMLGNALLTELSRKKDLVVFGTIRHKVEAQYLSEKLQKNIVYNIDVENTRSLVNAFDLVKPDIVLNCVGLIKQLAKPNDAELYILMNALLPHRLAALCGLIGARLIHFSTDCVFSGGKGNYNERDLSDAADIYGKTKYLGEVTGEHCLTLRTSIIGHGLETHVSLVDWFLNQQDKIQGFKKVIYSGLPTVEIARILYDYVFPHKKLSGLYHVSADPISKYDLLKLIAKEYGKKIEIKPFADINSDRSLDSSRFQKITGYKPPKWPILIKKMHQYYKKNNNFIQF